MTSVAFIQALERRRFLSNYFVSPAGNDAGNGSNFAPWKTLQHAADHVQPGDTVTVLAGTYAGFDLQTSGTPTERITFRADLGVIVNQRNHRTPDGINLERASHVTVRGFNVVGLPRAGIRSVRNAGVQIIGNVASKSGTWGILTGFSENVLIEGNVTRLSNGQHGIYVGNSADNPVIRGNVVWGNRQSGIQINSDESLGGDGIVTGALVENNTVYSNGVAGGSAINLDGVQKSIVRNNLLYDNRGSGISLYRADGAQGANDNLVVNNTIVMANDKDNPGRYALNIQDRSVGNSVRNNILYSYFARDRFAGSVQIANDSLSGFSSDYNVIVDAHGFLKENHATDLTSWRAMTGQDMHSKVLSASELFSDVPASDYHLRSDSQAIDAGAASGASKFDINGGKRPSGAGVDIGAFEYQRFVAPTDAQANANGPSSIKLTWTDNTHGNANVVVYRKVLGGAYVKVKSLSVGATSFVDAGLLPGTRYYYRLYAFSPAGRSALTDPIAAITAP